MTTTRTSRTQTTRSALAYTCALILLLLAFTPRSATAEETTWTEIIVQARAGDLDGLHKTIAKHKIDPWLVVDRLEKAGLTKPARDLAPRYGDALYEYARSFPATADKDRTALATLEAKLAKGEDPAQVFAKARPPRSRSVVTVLWWERLADAFADSESENEQATALERAADAARSIRWQRREVQHLEHVYECLQTGDQYWRIRRALARRLALGRELRSSPATLAATRFKLATADLALGNVGAAVGPIEEAMRHYRGRRNAAGVAHYRLLLAIALSKLGELAGAISQAEQATREFASLEDQASLDYAIQTRMSVLVDLGRNKSALQDFQLLTTKDRSDVHARVTDLLDRASILMNAAVAEARLGRPGASRLLFTKALREAKAAGSSEFQALALNLRSFELHERAGTIRSAIEDADAALSLAPNGTQAARYAAWTAGRAHRLGGLLPRAASRLRDALTEAEAVGDADLMCMARAELAKVALAQNDVDEALRLSGAALDGLRRVSAGLGDDEAVAARSTEFRQTAFEAFIEAASRKKDPVRVFQALEGARAWGLRVALGRPGAAEGYALEDDVRRRERDAHVRVKEARDDYARLREENPDVSLDEAKKAQTKIASALGALQSVIAEMQREERLRSGVAYPRQVTLQALQKSLPGDHAIVLYGRSKDALLALVVTNSARSLRRVGLTSDLQGIHAAKHPGEPADTTAYDTLVTALCDELLVSLKLPDSVRTVLVCPDNELSRLPWPDLGGRDVKKRRYLLLPSASVYSLLREGAAKRGTKALLVADPKYSSEQDGLKLRMYGGSRPLSQLVYSGVEIKAIKQQGDIELVKSEASESEVKRALKDLPEARRWRLIHLGCHGLVHDELPSMSALALSGEGEDDGFLTAAEVMRLRAPADLVVLSACDVGGGPTAKGEGLLGLTRAFMAAGASRVLASLWPADDRATAELMKRFHAERDKGASNFDALRSAQHYIRDLEEGRARPWAHPYYWAGWVLWGVPR